MPWEDLTEQQKAFLDKYFTRRFSDLFGGREKQDDNLKKTADYELAVELERFARVQVDRLPDDYGEVAKARADLEAGCKEIEAGRFREAVALLTGIPAEIDRTEEVWGAVVRDLRTEARKAADVADIGEPESKALADLGAEITGLVTQAPLPARRDLDAARLKVEDLRRAKLAAPALTMQRVRGAFDEAFLKARDGLEKAFALDQAPFAKVVGKDALAAAVEVARKVLEDARAADSATDRAVLEKATADLTAVMVPPTVEVLRLKCVAELEERKRRLAEIGATRQALQGEITRLCSLPQDTVEAGQLQRAIGFRNAQLGKSVAAEDLENAESCLTDLEAAIAGMKAEEAAIGKAGTLKEQALREWGALSADLKKARAIYVVAPEFKDDVEAFASADRSVQAFLHAKEFGRALNAIGALKPAMAKLIARHSEFGGIVSKREAVMAAKKEFETNGAIAATTPPLTPEAMQAVRSLVEVEGKLPGLIAAKDWDAALALLRDGIDKEKILVGLKDACDLLMSDAMDLGQRFQAFAATVKSHLEAEAIDPPYKQQIDLIRKQQDSVESLLTKDGDLSAGKVAMDDLEKLAPPLAALKLANDQAVQRRDDVFQVYTANKTTLEDARKVKPNTPKMLALMKQADADYKAFSDNYEAGPPNLLDLVNAAVLSAKAVQAELAEDAKAEDAAEEAYNDREKVVEPEVDAALDLARKNKPDLADVDAEIVALWDKAAKLYEDDRFLEGLAALEECYAAAAKVAGLVPQAEGRMLARKEDFERRYVKELTDKIVEIRRYQRIKSGVLQGRKALDALNKEVAAHGVAKEWDKGVAKLTKLEADVAMWVSFKPEHDQRVIDRDWLRAEGVKIVMRISQAMAMQAVDRETDAAVERFRSADARCSLKVKGTEYDYAEARAAFPEYIAAIDALLLLKAQHDLLVGKRDQVNTEYSTFADKITVCNGMQPITPELEKLLAAFRKANALFRKHYFGFDDDAALAALPALKKAATDLAAKKGEHDNALVQAKIDAAQTVQDLDVISADDLKKKKTTDDKLEFLKKLRGDIAKLDFTKLDPDHPNYDPNFDPKPREMQRKIYMAMDLDPDFLKVDEERRAKLIEAIKGDTDLHDAKAGWATETPEKKIALLRKTLKTECDIYGMPVPEIVLFEEPPGDLGSFNNGTGMINLNIHPEATFDDFFDTIDTVVHENAHNYQFFLVKRLAEGLIQPGDPEYKQALMFAANSGLHAYVTGKENGACYKKEPLEEHAWKTGGDVQEALKKVPAKVG